MAERVLKEVKVRNIATGEIVDATIYLVNCGEIVLKMESACARRIGSSTEWRLKSAEQTEHTTRIFGDKMEIIHPSVSK